MGNFFKNLSLLGPSQSDVAAALERHDRIACVTPERNRFTSYSISSRTRSGIPPSSAIWLSRYPKTWRAPSSRPPSTTTTYCGCHHSRAFASVHITPKVSASFEADRRERETFQSFLRAASCGRSITRRDRRLGRPGHPRARRFAPPTHPGQRAARQATPGLRCAPLKVY